MTSTEKTLYRLTINLIPRASAALDLAAQLTGDTKTDTVNRAIQFYAYAEEIISRGGDILIREDGELSPVNFRPTWEPATPA